jgi:ATP synthase protein I
MREMPPMNARAAAFRIPLWQGVLTMLLALAAFFLSGWPMAKSVLAGGFISALGSIVFALSVFATETDDSRVILRRMFRGEALKLALVAWLFYLAIVFLQVQALPTLAGFLVTLVVFWVALLRAIK